MMTGGRAIDAFLDEKMASLDASGTSEAAAHTMTMHERSIRRKVLKDFQGACTKCLKCANCGAFSPKIRHDQFNKMFQVGMPRRNVKVSLCLYRLGE
jgi:hypothetical protein